jgi:hypothetical protein
MLKRHSFLQHGQDEPPDDEYRTCNDANQDAPAPTAIAQSWPSFVDFVKSKTLLFNTSIAPLHPITTTPYHTNLPYRPCPCLSASTFINHDFKHPNTPNTHLRRNERQAQAGRAPRWRIVCEKGKTRSGRQGAARALQVSPLSLSCPRGTDLCVDLRGMKPRIGWRSCICSRI